eukprot:TRINITY_DN433_c0_g1_i3.p1 TRINITY_DN433_c0_g1~~TRINITY_DN433_c0_g1_i3.p1  ORF type:complete len:227 (+),score=38.67 TRINITY_DN433_c0_g1_i3:962-1642(+)
MFHAVYIDEASWTRVNPGQGWSLKGMRPICMWESHYAVSMTLVVALIPSMGVVYHEIVAQTVNGDRFRLFLENLLEHLPEMPDDLKEMPRLVVMDNASIHKCKPVKDFFEKESSKLRQFQLPLFSPFLNPCEECFALWKFNFLKLQLDYGDAIVDMSERHALISLAGSKITKKNCMSWYRNSRGYLRDDARKVPIMSDCIPDGIHQGDECFAPRVQEDDPYRETSE